VNEANVHGFIEEDHDDPFCLEPSGRGEKSFSTAAIKLCL